jgi:hypothetical protein
LLPFEHHRRSYYQPVAQCPHKPQSIKFSCHDKHNTSIVSICGSLNGRARVFTERQRLFTYSLYFCEALWLWDHTIDKKQYRTELM